LVGGLWSGFTWLGIGTVGGLLWVRWWTFGFWRHGVRNCAAFSKLEYESCLRCHYITLYWISRGLPFLPYTCEVRCSVSFPWPDCFDQEVYVVVLSNPRQILDRTFSCTHLLPATSRHRGPAPCTL
jgi:hypothetical protein